jgi:Domain of unknown function (DUF1707)
MTNPCDNLRRRDPKVRASDADREAIGEILREQHAEGRLDSEEMQERIDACYRAKTVGELEQLLADLPARDSAGQPTRPRFGTPRMGMVRLWPILIALALVSAITGHFFFWIAIPLVFLATRFFAPPCARRRRGPDGGVWI